MSPTRTLLGCCGCRTGAGGFRLIADASIHEPYRISCRAARASRNLSEGRHNGEPTCAVEDVLGHPSRFDGDIFGVTGAAFCCTGFSFRGKQLVSASSLDFGSPAGSRRSPNQTKPRQLLGIAGSTGKGLKVDMKTDASSQSCSQDPFASSPKLHLSCRFSLKESVARSIPLTSCFSTWSIMACRQRL